jgi:hypothetical protein
MRGLKINLKIIRFVLAPLIVVTTFYVSEYFFPNGFYNLGLAILMACVFDYIFRYLGNKVK